MGKLWQSSPRNLKLSLTKVASLAAGAALAVPVGAAASVMALDLIEQRGRRERKAPRPGTFHSQLADSQLRIFTDGATLYDEMIAAIDTAENSIMMETYIWKNDEVGQRFIDAFNNAAARGVTVHLIYDGFANLVVPHSFYRQLSEKINVFRLPAIGRNFWEGPLRYTGFNHSKILVVDDVTAFVGGYNIGSLYAREWRDTHLQVSDANVWELRQSIARVWNEKHQGEDHIDWIPPRNWNPEIRVAANLPVQLAYPIRNMYLQAFARAQDHIWVTTPYFIPDQQILRVLLEAAERGVDVRVMVPEDSNHVVADWVSRGFFGQMLDSGISILLYRSAMTHSKIATIDGEWSTIGTANIDRLSLTFNYETNVEIIDPDFAAEMEKIFRRDAEHCEVVTSPQWRDRHPMARLTEMALKPLRPLL